MICGVPNFGEAPGESASHYELSRIRLIVTSRQVAEHFGKQHKDVLRAIRNLECSGDFTERNFAPVEYLDVKGEAAERRLWHLLPANDYCCFLRVTCSPRALGRG